MLWYYFEQDCSTIYVEWGKLERTAVGEDSFAVDLLAGALGTYLY